MFWTSERIKTKSFLNSEIEVGDSKKQVSELVLGDFEIDEESFVRFKELTEEFVDKNIWDKNKAVQEFYSSFWIKPLDIKDSIITWEPNSKYSKYGVYREKQSLGGSFFDSCNPKGKNSNLFYVYSGDKKIALCVEYKK